MRVLCSSVLIFEAIVIGLFIPVAINAGGYPAGVVGAVGGVTALLALIAPRGLGSGWGITLGWAIQVAMIASGFFVPMMFVLGAAFAALWWAALHYGRKADEIRAGHTTESGTTSA